MSSLTPGIATIIGQKIKDETLAAGEQTPQIKVFTLLKYLGHVGIGQRGEYLIIYIAAGGTKD